LVGIKNFNNYSKRSFCFISDFINLRYWNYSLFTKVKPGFLNRTLTILVFIFIPFLYFVSLSAIKYIDLKRNSKIRIQVEIMKLKKVRIFFFVSKKDNFKIKIFEDLIPLIDINPPLIVKFAKYSKVLLFVSNNNLNLLNKM